MTSQANSTKKPGKPETNSFTTVTEASTSAPGQNTAGDEQDLKSKAKAEAAKLAEQARAAADARIEEAKDGATARIDETASNIRSAGREFGQDSYQAQAADYLADNLIEAAARIRAQDLDSVAREATDFARRNPAIVLGGAALLGFAAARLLKASDDGGRA